jgi:hypothetical protein
MNFQINAAIIAALAGLIAAVLIQASGVMSGNIPPLDTLVPFDLRVLGYWVGVLGFFPLIFILIAIGVTARRAGLRSSTFTGVGAVAGVLLVVICAVIALGIVHAKKDYPFREAGAGRASFVKDASAFCLKNQHVIRGKNQSALTTSNEAICSCYGSSLADMTTTAELAYMNQYHSYPPSLTAKTGIVSQRCVQLVRASQ